jgi:hypothetical protein
MPDQFPNCEAKLPSFGHVWATRVRSWCTSRSSRSPFPVARDREPQHLDKLLVRGEEPQPGSHLISPRRGYTHHGIYIGDDKVVHYAGLARGQFRGRVEEDSLPQFACGRSVWTRSSDLPGFVPQEVIRRARSRVGENRYRILRNNCEHFCEWCLRGESRSYQVERFLSPPPCAGHDALGPLVGRW